MKRELNIDGIRIADDTDAFIIAEVCHNHQGDLEKCKELFRKAKASGASAVKLQKRDNRSLFTRSMFVTPDMIRQHEILNEVAKMVDAGDVHTTVGEHFGSVNAANLKRAHALLVSGKARGKIVLEGF